jgi:hypothetical protein
VLEDFYPVRWVGGKAIVTLPGHIGASNAGQVRDALLSVINLGAVTLIDMFGYGPGEMAGLPGESFVPAGLHKSHRRHRAAWARSPPAWPRWPGSFR